MKNKKATSTSIGILVIGVFLTFGLILAGLYISKEKNSENIALTSLIESSKTIAEEILFYEKIGLGKTEVLQRVRETAKTKTPNYFGKVEIDYKENHYIINLNFSSIKFTHHLKSSK